MLMTSAPGSYVSKTTYASGFDTRQRPKRFSVKMHGKGLELGSYQMEKNVYLHS